MKIQTPHDRFFKETFGKIEVAKDFLENYLPDSIIKIIDVNTLEPQKDSFIDENLKVMFADMLFKVDINKKEGYIYFLFEHKSSTSKNISFQLLKYMIQIWEYIIENKGMEEVPIILPIVIYHGERSWKVNPTLGGMIKGYDMLPKDVQKHIPDYEYLLYDVSRFSDEEIKGGVINKIIMTTLRDIMTKDEEGIIASIYKMAEYLVQLKDRQTGTKYFEILMRYIFNAKPNFSKETANEIKSNIETTYPEGSEVIMTLAEKLREEGKKEGRQEGRQEGKKEGLIDSAIRVLRVKFGALPQNTIKQIEKLSVEKLELLIDDILLYEKLEDVDKYLK
jgi:predicted transposase/invertase (TIGR01784 family)